MANQYFPKVITGLTVTRSGWHCFARVLGNQGIPITQASIASMSYTVRDLTGATTVVAGVSVTVSSAIFDSLQQSDGRWVKDSEDTPGPDGRWGYNLYFNAPASYFTSFDVDDTAPYEVLAHRTRVDLLVTPTTGEPFVIPFESTPIPTWTS